MNKYGHFDDKNRQYVITRPDTPIPWINFLGSNEFYGILTNTAGGYTFYRDARLRRLTTDIIMFRWTVTAGIYTSKMVIPCGIPPGNRPIRLWTAMSAVTDWAIASLPE